MEAPLDWRGEESLEGSGWRGGERLEGRGTKKREKSRAGERERRLG